MLILAHYTHPCNISQGYQAVSSVLTLCFLCKPLQISVRACCLLISAEYKVLRVTVTSLILLINSSKEPRNQCSNYKYNISICILGTQLFLCICCWKLKAKVKGYRSRRMGTKVACFSFLFLSFFYCVFLCVCLEGKKLKTNYQKILLFQSIKPPARKLTMDFISYWTSLTSWNNESTECGVADSL